jgi:hypothetical protein
MRIPLIQSDLLTPHEPAQTWCRRNPRRGNNVSLSPGERAGVRVGFPFQKTCFHLRSFVSICGCASV